MPIYEYICLDCDNQFETMVLSSEEEVACPSCQSKRLEKVMSAFAMAGLGRGDGGAATGSCSGGGGFS